VRTKGPTTTNEPCIAGSSGVSDSEYQLDRPGLVFDPGCVWMDRTVRSLGGRSTLLDSLLACYRLGTDTVHTSGFKDVRLRWSIPDRAFERNDIT